MAKNGKIFVFILDIIVRILSFVKSVLCGKESAEGGGGRMIAERDSSENPETKSRLNDLIRRKTKKGGK